MSLAVELTTKCREVETKRGDELIGLTGEARVAKLREFDVEALGSQAVLAGEALNERRDGAKREDVCDDLDGRYKQYRPDVANVYRGRGRLSKRRNYFVPSAQFLRNYDRIFGANQP